MTKESQMTQNYLYAFSNLIAAFGGGMILGKGIGIIDNPYLQGGSLSAFFLGTVLGLLLLQFIPKKISNHFARYFSICGGIASLILIAIFEKYSVNQKMMGISSLFFFVFLSIRFSFWFYSRVLRASHSAGYKQRIAWVELGYYVGMICGLIIWSYLGIEFGMITALLIDAVLQVVAGLVDLCANDMILLSVSNEIAPVAQAISIHPKKENAWGWRLTFAVALLTIGVQIIIFSLTHHMTGYYTSYILASFYLGAAVSAFTCKKLKVQLGWKLGSDNRVGRATIFSEKTGSKVQISSVVVGLLVSFFVTMTLLVASWIVDHQHDGVASMSVASFLFLICIFLSAFFYEMLALVILDRIGLEDKRHDGRSPVVRAYGLMGVGAVMSLWVLGITKSSFFGLFFTLGTCVIFSIFLLRKRGGHTLQLKASLA